MFIHETTGLEPAPIFAVKTVPPRLKQVLLRPRLIEMAKPELRHKLLVISAPGGYGKTILMAQMASSCPGRHIWYRLSEIDNSPAQFLRHLIQAVTIAGGGASSRSLDLLAFAFECDIERDFLKVIFSRL